MATRLLIQKFSRMSMSSSLLGAHASAAAPEGVFQGAAVHPGMTAPSKPAIHCYAARYFNVFPCSHADAKTSLTTTGMPSTITNCMKPSFLDFSGVKKTFSSSASKSNNHKFATQAKMAALRAQDAARKPLSAIEQARKDTDTTIALMAFTCLGILYMSANDNRSTDNGSSRCSNCCYCQCHGPNPKVQQD